MTPPNDSYWVYPGRLLAGPYPGDMDASVAEMKIGQLVSEGVSLFVDLTEEGELKPYAQHVEGTGARHVRHSIRDVDVPAQQKMHATLRTIRAALGAGEVVYVHCWGGVGRTGTVIGCLLVEDGAPACGVSKQIAGLRRGTQRRERRSPETDAQQNFIAEWGERQLDR